MAEVDLYGFAEWLVIVMVFKDGKRLEIPPKSVTSLSYGQEAHRRVGTMVALAVLVSPVALFGLMHKTRLHYIGIQYHEADGKHADSPRPGSTGTTR